ELLLHLDLELADLIFDVAPSGLGIPLRLAYRPRRSLLQRGGTGGCFGIGADRGRRQRVPARCRLSLFRRGIEKSEIAGGQCLTVSDRVAARRDLRDARLHRRTRTVLPRSKLRELRS